MIAKKMICSLAQGGRLLSRSFSSSATPSSNTPGLLEWRRYKIRFEGMQEFLRLTEESAALRKSLHPGWLGFFTPDTGGCLTSVHHIYHYDDMLHRQEVRAKASEEEGWKAYRAAIGPHVVEQESSIFKPAVQCIEAGGAPLIQDFKPEPEEGVMYELRWVTQRALRQHPFAPFSALFVALFAPLLTPRLSLRCAESISCIQATARSPA